MITIRDVAAQARVSIATVSRVVSESGGVAPDTRDRVLATVERLGYRPNAVAQRLRAYHDATRPLPVNAEALYDASLMGAPKPTSPNSLSDQVAQYLVRYIRDRGLGSGARIPSELRISEELDISRGVVREACRAL